MPRTKVYQSILKSMFASFWQFCLELLRCFLGDMGSNSPRMLFWRLASFQGKRSRFRENQVFDPIDLNRFLIEHLSVPWKKFHWNGWITMPRNSPHDLCFGYLEGKATDPITIEVQVEGLKH